jgi:hypothetical protein
VVQENEKEREDEEEDKLDGRKERNKSRRKRYENEVKDVEEVGGRKQDAKQIIINMSAKEKVANR